MHSPPNSSSGDESVSNPSFASAADSSANDIPLRGGVLKRTLKENPEGRPIIRHSSVWLAFAHRVATGDTESDPEYTEPSPPVCVYAGRNLLHEALDIAILTMRDGEEAEVSYPIRTRPAGRGFFRVAISAVAHEIDISPQQNRKWTKHDIVVSEARGPKPEYESTVTVSMTVIDAATERVIDTATERQLCLGDAECPPEVDAALQTMSVGDTCLVTKYTSGHAPNWGLFGGTQHQIKLVAFSSPALHSLKGKTLVRYGSKKREEGNAFYTNAQKKGVSADEDLLWKAIGKYERGAAVLASAGDEEAKAECALLFGNAARAHTTLGNFAKAVAMATEALACAPKSPKPLLVRATALRNLNRLAEAAADIAEALSQCPSSPELLDEQQNIAAAQKDMGVASMAAPQAPR